MVDNSAALTVFHLASGMDLEKVGELVDQMENFSGAVLVVLTVYVLVDRLADGLVALRVALMAGG